MCEMGSEEKVRISMDVMGNLKIIKNLEVYVSVAVTLHYKLPPLDFGTRCAPLINLNLIIMNAPSIESVRGEIVTLKSIVYHEGQADESLLTILEIEATDGRIKTLKLSDNASAKFLVGFAIGQLVNVQFEVRVKDSTEYVAADGTIKQHTVDGIAIVAIRNASYSNFAVDVINSATTDGKAAAIAAFLRR